MTKLYLDWQKVGALHDKQLQLCVALTRDHKTLTGLAKGFPELFTDNPAEPPVVAKSVFISCAEDAETKAESGDSPGSVLAAERFGLPIIAISTEDESADAAVIRQFEALEAREIKTTSSGLDHLYETVTVRSELFFIVDFTRYPPNRWRDRDNWYVLAIPARFIDLDK